MSIPSINVIFRRTNTAPNPQDLSAFGVVIDASSTGTVNQVQTLGSLAACLAAGSGPGPEQAAEIGLSGGWPVYLCRCAATPQAPSAVTKTPASAGVPFTVYGSARLDGADLNGDTLWQGKVAGVSFAAQAGASLVFAFSGVDNKDVTLDVPAATPADDIEAYYLGGTADAIAARALVAFKKYGTGNSNSNQTLARVYFDNGAITYTPLSAGYEVRQQFGAGATNGGTFGGQQLSATPTTNADSQPTSTASALVAAMAANLANKITAVAGGSGAGAPGELASFQALQFGSTGTVTLSGTGNDAYNFKIEILSGGTVGGSPAPTFKWSADNGVNWSSGQVIPPGGAVLLSDTALNTGITATFANVQEAKDLYAFTVSRPTVAGADLLTALDAVIADTSRKVGFVTSMAPITRTQGVQIDTKLQAARAVRYLRGFFNVRDIAEGVPGETEAVWSNAIIAEWAGFVSTNGLLRMCAGPVSHLSGLSNRNFRRPSVIKATARKARSAVHQSLAETAMGPLERIRYAIDPVSGVVTDPGIYHDERKLPGLSDQRFITTRTYAERGDGEQYFTTSPTMADPSDVAHAFVFYNDVLMEAARIAAEAAFVLIEKPAEGIAAAESAQVPKGAIYASDAAKIENLVGGAVDAFLFRPKSDNLPSASPLAEGESTITVLRNYNYIGTRELRMEMTVRPLGYNSSITLGVTLDLS